MFELKAIIFYLKPVFHKAGICLVMLMAKGK